MKSHPSGSSPPCRRFAASVPRPRGAHCRPPWNPPLASSLLGGTDSAMSPGAGPGESLLFLSSGKEFGA